MPLFQLRILVLLIAFVCWTGGTILSQDQTDDKYAKNFKITGQVIDELNKPVQGATASLQLEGRDKNISALTNDTGNFEITWSAIGESNPSTYLWVYAEGFNLKCVRPQMETEQQFLPCEVVLNDEEWINVKVLDSNGGPCRDAIIEPHHFDVPNGVYYSEQSTGLISIVPKDVAETFRVTTNSAGEAELRGIPIRKTRKHSLQYAGNHPSAISIQGKEKL